MDELLWVAYATATILLPAVILYFVIRNYYRHKDPLKPKENMILLILLSVYLSCVFYVTSAGTLYDYLRTGFEYHADDINLIPFAFNSYSIQYVLNVVMFLPFGFLLPLIWPQLSKLRYVLSYSFAFSLFIEVSQLLNRRVTDVDDLVMNVLGAFIGFLIFWAFQASKKKRNLSVGRTLQNSVARPALYLGFMFLGYFFLYNGLGLAALLYKFGG